MQSAQAQATVAQTLPVLQDRLVSEIENTSANPVTDSTDIEAARSHLHALIGDVTLKPIDGVLWAHPAPNAKSLTEVRPLDGLSINSPEMVAGAGFEPATFGL